MSERWGSGVGRGGLMRKRGGGGEREVLGEPVGEEL